MEKQVSYQTIGENKRRPRLWIEGIKLNTAGFERGAAYTVQIDDGIMTLTLDPNGTRRVSGKTRGSRDIPILDIALKELEENFDIGTRVRVVFTQGQIKVALHHEVAAKVTRERAFRKNLASGELTEASMFTGGGISTHAIHQAITDFGKTAKLAWVVDAELKYLQSAYGNNYAITDETTAIIGRAEEIEAQFFRKVDILSFSMPCASFSSAGKAKHKKDPEAHEGAAALFGTLSGIRSSNPAVLVSENVVEAKNSPAYALLKTELVRLGYVIHERVMTAADTGSIENRARWWFVAISEGLAEGFDFDLIHTGADDAKRTINSILDEDIPESAWADNTYLKDKAIRDKESGKGFTRQLLTGEETSCGTIGRFYQKRRSTEPFLTRGDNKERLLTPAEHARVKSAPEGLVDGLPATTAHEVLGQSVDWRQAYLAMACVMAHFTGKLAATVRSAKASVQEVATKVTVDTRPAEPAEAQLTLI